MFVLKILWLFSIAIYSGRVITAQEDTSWPLENNNLTQYSELSEDFPTTETWETVPDSTEINTESDYSPILNLNSKPTTKIDENSFNQTETTEYPINETDINLETDTNLYRQNKVMIDKSNTSKSKARKFKNDSTRLINNSPKTSDLEDAQEDQEELYDDLFSDINKRTAGDWNGQDESQPTVEEIFNSPLQTDYIIPQNETKRNFSGNDIIERWLSEASNKTTPDDIITPAAPNAKIVIMNNGKARNITTLEGVVEKWEPTQGIRIHPSSIEVTTKSGKKNMNHGSAKNASLSQKDSKTEPEMSKQAEDFLNNEREEDANIYAEKNSTNGDYYYPDEIETFHNDFEGLASSSTPLKLSPSSSPAPSLSASTETESFEGSSIGTVPSVEPLESSKKPGLEETMPFEPTESSITQNYHTNSSLSTKLDDFKGEPSTFVVTNSSFNGTNQQHMDNPFGASMKSTTVVKPPSTTSHKTELLDSSKNPDLVEEMTTAEVNHTNWDSTPKSELPETSVEEHQVYAENMTSKPVGFPSIAPGFSDNSSEIQPTTEKLNILNASGITDLTKTSTTTEFLKEPLKSSPENEVWNVVQKPSPQASYHGSLENEEGVTCLSLNFDVGIFVNGSKLELPHNVVTDEVLTPHESVMMFSWYTNDANTSLILGVQCVDGDCWIDSVDVIILSSGKEITAHTEKEQLFRTKIGTTFNSTTDTYLVLGNGIEIFFSKVSMTVLEDLQLRKFDGSSQLLTKHFPELIGGCIVGFVIILTIVLYTIKKYRKRNNFKPNVA